MTGTDVFIVLVLLASTLIGAFRGFAREAVSLVTWVLGFWLAWKLGPAVEPYLGGLLAEPAVRPWVARSMVLLAVVIVGVVVGLLVDRFVRSPVLSVVDRLMGTMFGLVRGAVLVGLAVIACQLLQLDHSGWWRQAKLIPYGETVAVWLRTLVNEQGEPWRSLKNVTRVR
jgi:membrane protein required for colicin V production